jgi:Putative MetA-pathway of phenol degradation
MRWCLARPAGVFSSLLFVLVAPAQAHHPGVGGGTGGGGPINTISAGTLDEGQIAAAVRYEFIRLGQLSDASLLAAASQGNHAHSMRSIESAALSVAYGVTNDFTVSVRLPGVRRSGIREPAESEDMLSGGHMGGFDSSSMSSLMSSGGINARGSSAGFSDVTLLGQYRFHQNAATGTEAAVLFGFKAPTGSTRERDNFGQLFEAEFQPGSGSFDGLIGAAFTKRFGRWSFDASGLYMVIGKGTQDTDLGDRFLFGAGVSYRLIGPIGSAKEVALHDKCQKEQNRLQEFCLYHANHDHRDMMKTPYTLDLVLEFNGEWHDKQRISGVADPNSGGTTVYLSPGVRVGVDRFSGFVSVGVPVINQHNGVQSKPDFRVLTGVAARLN